MSKEIERRFYTFDRKILEEKIKEFGGVKKGMYLFQILVFIPPKSYSMLRLRDEGYRITFTLKKRGSDGYEIEDEVIVKKPKNSSCTQNLSSITSDLKNWSCILKLIKKTGLLKSKSGIDIIKFQTSDEIKSIEAISFGQDALNHEKELQIGRNYYIENAKIGLSNSKKLKKNVPQ